MAETIYGDSGNNSLQGTPNADLIFGFQGQDTIQGNGGSDTIFGGQDADSIQYGVQPAGGGNGSPLIYGGEGADTVISLGVTGNATIVGDTGTASIDSASGGADYIDARLDSGADVIFGNYGDDTILGTTVAAAQASFGSTAQGTTELIGGFGNDVIDFGSTVGGATNSTSGPAFILGNQGNDTITADASNLTVFGGTGNDTINVVNGNSQAGVTDLIYGGEGNDVISVSGGNNTILGGTGNAAIDSQAGPLGDGNDLIVVGAATAGNDLILGNYGDDTINASGQASSTSAMDTLVGGQGNDVVFGSRTVNNFILGNQGDDAISDTLAGAGTDTVSGGQGNDTIVVGDSVIVPGAVMTMTMTSFMIISAAGTNGMAVIPSTSTSTTTAPATTLFGANYLVYGNEGNNSISVQGSGNDTIYGGNTANDAVGNGDGNNVINVSSQLSGNDLIFGGSGNDSINTGSTSTTLFDTVTGGVGADVFRYANASATGANAGTRSAAGTASGNDVITDMVSGVDKIAATGNPVANFSNIGSVSGTSLNQAAAAAEAILTQQYGAGTNAATFTYQGSTDTYAVVATNAGGANTTNLLVDIKATTQLAKGDFIA